MQNKQNSQALIRGNALKNKGTGELATATVIFKCTPTQKTKWVTLSKLEGKKLTDWVIEKLP